MIWNVTYHPRVADDLDSLGPTRAAQIMRVIDHRLHRGEPDKTGKPLSGDLAGCHRIRTGALRIVYRLDVVKRQVHILAVGPRRRDEVYTKAERRI